MGWDRKESAADWAREKGTWRKKEGAPSNGGWLQHKTGEGLEESWSGAGARWNDAAGGRARTEEIKERGKHGTTEGFAEVGHPEGLRRGGGDRGDLYALDGPYVDHHQKRQALPPFRPRTHLCLVPGGQGRQRWSQGERRAEQGQEVCPPAFPLPPGAS